MQTTLCIMRIAVFSLSRILVKRQQKKHKIIKVLLYYLLSLELTENDFL